MISIRKNNTNFNSNLLEKIEFHDTLNPKLFDLETNTLLPDIREDIEKIVDKFLDILSDQNIDIIPLDIVILGSNCSYNYTEHSDLDIHIIADGSLNCDKNHLDKLYDAYRKIFNSTYDITLNDIPIEIYVEIDECKANSNGIYSIYENKWIKEPEELDDIEIDDVALDKKFNVYKNRYENIINRKNGDQYKLDMIYKFIDDLYDQRKTSINKDGEYGLGNLLFKKFRDLGYLDNLKNIKIKLENKNLSA